MSAYRVFLLLGAASALFTGLIDPIIAVYYVRVVGLAPLQLVLLGTVVEVAGLLFEVPTGVVADLYSRRLSVIIGVFSVGACFVVQGLLPFLGPIVAAEALRRVTQPLFTGWVNRHVDSRVRATVLSMGGQVDAVGQLTGGPAIGLLAQLVSLRAAMVGVGVTLLPALPLLARAGAAEPPAAPRQPHSRQ